MRTASTRTLLVSPALGAGLGLAASAAGSASSPYGSIGDLVDPRWYPVLAFLSLVLGAGWAWAALPVLVGWLATGLRRGALAGAAGLVAATVSYYLLDAGLRDEPFVTSDVWHWSLAGILLGPLLGLVGATIRRGGTLGALAALVVPVGAALQMVVLAPGVETAEPRPVALVARGVVASAAVLGIVLVLVRFFAGRPRLRP